MKKKLRKKVTKNAHFQSPRVTRAAAKCQRLENEEAEQLKIVNEQWIREGQVVNPEFEDPPTEITSLWQLFIKSVSCHPNMLVHRDVQCIRDLFQLFGSYIQFDSDNIVIQLETSNDDSTMHCLQPYSKSEITQFVFLLGKLNDFEIVPGLNVAIIRKYEIMPDLKTALLDMVEFIATYPEVLLYPNYGYVYEFLVQFGVSPDRITYEVFQTQLRRKDKKYPPSTLLLKFGIPEIDSKTASEEFNGIKIEECLDFDQDFTFKKIERSKGGRIASSSDEDSGIDVCDNHNLSEIGERDLKVENLEFNDSNKQYQCPVCLRRYISKGNCNSHIRKRHPNDPLLPGSKNMVHEVAYFCQICNKGFTSSTYVRNHIEKLHPEIPSHQQKLLILKKENSQNMQPSDSKISDSKDLKSLCQQDSKKAILPETDTSCNFQMETHSVKFDFNIYCKREERIIQPEMF